MLQVAAVAQQDKVCTNKPLHHFSELENSSSAGNSSGVPPGGKLASPGRLRQCNFKPNRLSSL